VGSWSLAHFASGRAKTQTGLIMNSHLFLLELKLLARERAAWVMCALFAVALAYGIWNGSRLAQGQQDATSRLSQETAEFETQLRDALARQSVDPKAVAGRGTTAVLPSAPLPLLATGQSDLLVGHETVVLWKLAGPGDTRSELANPSHLMAGHFDLAFVLVWLYPLFLLALVFDLMAGDREAGTLRLALAQGITPWYWMARRATARALPMLTLAALATLIAGFLGDSSDVSTRLVLALAIVVGYGFFWIALAVAVNAVARSAAEAATALGGAWVLMVLVLPTLLNLTVETLFPTPSRPELVAAGRKASGVAEKRSGELLNTFYRDHPELAPPGQQADFAAQHLTVQSEVGRAVEPVRQKFDEQLDRQQAAVGRWRFLSPAIAAHEALIDLAGTGYWRHRTFREQVRGLQQDVSKFFTPLIHKREPITIAHLDKLPRFEFREEPAAVWSTRVISSLAGMLALTAVLSLWAWRNLRPARLGLLST
jgi:ABC-2 type transport system permease protein